MLTMRKYVAGSMTSQLYTSYTQYARRGDKNCKKTAIAIATATAATTATATNKNNRGGA